MSLSGQKKGPCDQILAVFDMHQKCARCREKGTGSDTCVLAQEDCQAGALLIPDQGHMYNFGTE